MIYFEDIKISFNKVHFYDHHLKPILTNNFPFLGNTQIGQISAQWSYIASMFTMVKLSLELFILTGFWTADPKCQEFRHSPSMFVYILILITILILLHFLDLFTFSLLRTKVQENSKSHLSTLPSSESCRKSSNFLTPHFEETHSLTITHKVWDHRFWHLKKTWTCSKVRWYFFVFWQMVLNFGTNTTHNAVLGLEFSQNMCRTELAFWGKEEHFFSS